MKKILLNTQKPTAPNVHMSNSILRSPSSSSQKNRSAFPKITYLSISYFWRQRLTELWIHFKSDVQNTNRNLWFWTFEPKYISISPFKFLLLRHISETGTNYCFNYIITKNNYTSLSTYNISIFFDSLNSSKAERKGNRAKEIDTYIWENIRGSLCSQCQDIPCVEWCSVSRIRHLFWGI